MFYFSGTRRPNYKNLDKEIYDNYWRNRGYKMRDKLMEREHVFLDWIKPNNRVLSIGCGNSRLLYELKKQRSHKYF